MSTNIKLGIKNAIKQVGINWTDEQLNEALNVFGNIEMNGYLIQGFVQYYNTGDFNGLTKGGIYLFHSTNESIDNTPVSDGILEVLPSRNTAGTEQMVIQRVTAISQNEATGAIYLRSGRYANNTWTWISNPKWIAISTSGGTQTLDTVVTEDSQNPVTSAGIYDFVENQIVQATDPYIEVYLSRTNNIIDSTLLMRFVNFQEAVPTTYAALVSSNDFKKALLNNVLVYMGAYGDSNTALACQGSLMSGNAYFPLPTDQYWCVCLTTTIIWQGEYAAFLTGYPIYDDGAWYLTNVNVSAPYWVDEVQDARDYTTERTTFTRSDNPTVTVGGITPQTNLEDWTLLEIIEQMLYPHVPFNYTALVTNAAGGSFEYGTAKSITQVKPTYDGGTNPVINMKVGTTSGGSNLYNGAPPASNAFKNLTTSLSLDGKTNTTIYVQLTDDYGYDSSRSVSFSFPYYYYWANTNSTATPGSLSASNVIRGDRDPDGDVSGVQTDNNSYLFFFVPPTASGSQIQQYAMSQWNNVDTISIGTVTFLTSTNQSITTYKAYRTSMLLAGSGNRFRIK